MVQASVLNTVDLSLNKDTGWDLTTRFFWCKSMTTWTEVVIYYYTNGREGKSRKPLCFHLGTVCADGKF